MFYLIKEFVKEAGQYSYQALAKQHDISYKEANDAILSIVTEVDIRNSKAFKDFVKKNFNDLNYLIIDEESIDSLGGNLFEKIASTEYQFILDPIDGTLNYSSGLPFYGVLAAVFKRGKPLYGYIYAPALDDLVYTDGKQIYREHFGKTEILNNYPKGRSRVVQSHIWEVKLKPNHINGNFIAQDYFSAAIYSLYLSLGQLRAVISTAKLWDIAPLMTIGKIAGFGIYDYHTNEEIEISPKFMTENGKIKNMMFMGFKNEAAEIKDIFAETIKV